jgi:hypothetical protein
LQPEVARELIEGKVAESLRARNLKRLRVFNPRPVMLKVELATPDRANQYMGKVGIEISGARTVISRGEDCWQAWDQFWPN